MRNYYHDISLHNITISIVINADGTNNINYYKGERHELMTNDHLPRLAFKDTIFREIV